MKKNDNFNASIDKKTGRVIIENARITYRNFKGEKTQYNHAGDRNFNVYIDDEIIANAMNDDKWNIKIKLADKEDPLSEKSYLMKVNVNYNSEHPERNPKIYLHTGNNAVLLEEEGLAQLDTADIISCDMIINPYSYEKNGEVYKSAYLKSMHIVIEDDPFAEKYSSSFAPEAPEE